MKLWLSCLLPLSWGQQYSAAYPAPKPPTPYSSAYEYAVPTPPPSSSYQTYVPPQYTAPPPTRKAKAKGKGKKEKAYVSPTLPYVAPTPVYVAPTPVYVAPTPEPTYSPTPEPTYSPTPSPTVAPTSPYVAPTPQYVAPPPTSQAYQYNPAAIPPAPETYSKSDVYTQAYPVPNRPQAPPPTNPGKYSAAYQLPQTPVQQQYITSPTPAPTAYQVRTNNALVCTQSAVGCYQGHIRLCVPGQRQDNAKIIRRCNQGCQQCPEGVPDACISDRYTSNICDTLAVAHRAGRTCSRQQEGQVGCLGGPDIGYCTAGSILLVDYCGSAGCIGSPAPDQCNPLVSTPPPTYAVTLAPVTPDNICNGNFVFCWQGHIRLCLDQQPKDLAGILQDCRSQGCSVCPSGPDICNDPDGSDVCTLVPRDRQTSTCPAAQLLNTFCDGTDVRHCDATGRGILVEFCGQRGCKDSPAICNPIVTNDNQICNGSYVLCSQGHVRLCQDGQPMSQLQILQNCRSQGCSNCPNAPAICNDESGNSLCGQVPPSDFVQACDAGIPPATTYCAANDVRHCDPSGRAFLVEYCANRGCQSNPLSCNSALPAPTPLPPSPAVNNNNNNNGNNGATLKPCTTPRVRREWGSLPDADRMLFINGLLALYKRGDCAQLAQFHYDNRDAIHGTNCLHFFPWHRVLLFDIETRIRSIPGYECVTIPYWNYQYSNNPQARMDRRSPFGTGPTKLGQGDNADCIGGVFSFYKHTLDAPGPHCIKRAPTDLQSTMGSALFMDLANVGEPTFLTFANNLQVAHGTPHVSFGDTFATHYSPIDPLFWVHHANIDRTWDIWQDCHEDYWWYEAGALNQPIIAYPGVVAGDFIDNAKIKWKGQPYSVSYSTDNFQDPSAYSSDFRRNVITRCDNNQLRRYTTPNPILGVDDAWTTGAGGVFQQRTLILPDGTQQLAPAQPFTVQETGAFIQCSSRGLDTNHGPIIATYSNVSATSCAAKCDKFFFRPYGDNNCMCTSTGRRNTTRVQITDLSVPILKIAYFTGCDGADQNDYGFYDLANAQKASTNPPSAASNTRRLLQRAVGKNPRLAAGALSAGKAITSRPSVAPVSRAQLQANANAPGASGISNLNFGPLKPPSDQDLCYDQQTDDNGQSVPTSCSANTSKPILPNAWLQMNKLTPDSADPCSKYKPAVGFHGVSCVNQ